MFDHSVLHFGATSIVVFTRSYLMFDYSVLHLGYAVWAAFLRSLAAAVSQQTRRVFVQHFAWVVMAAARNCGSGRG